MKKLLIAVLLLVILGGVAFLLLSTRTRSVVRVNEADPRLQQAITEARSELPTFWRLVRSAPADRQRDFAVKVRFRTESGAEFLWVRGPLRRSSEVTGTLDQRPMVLSAQRGDEVRFREGDIVDWLARDEDGSLRGGRTDKVLTDR